MRMITDNEVVFHLHQDLPVTLSLKMTEKQALIISFFAETVTAAAHVRTCLLVPFLRPK